MPTTSTVFPTGNATVREVLAALSRVPDDQLDRELVVMVHLEGLPADDLVPALPTMFEQFPATVADPQPDPAVFHLYCVEGDSVAAQVETLRAMAEFAQEQDR